MPEPIDISVYADGSIRAPALAAFERLMALTPRPSAVICDDDSLAVQLLSHCETSGVRVPADLSIIGLGDSETARQGNPRLTSLRIPWDDMATNAAERLLSRIGKRDFSGRSVRVKLVVRATTMPAAVGVSRETLDRSST